MLPTWQPTRTVRALCLALCAQVEAATWRWAVALRTHLVYVRHLLARAVLAAACSCCLGVHSQLEPVVICKIL